MTDPHDRPGAADADHADEILRFLTVLHGGVDGVFEIRAPKCRERANSDFRSTTAGYYQPAQIAKAASDAASLDASGLSSVIYVTLNLAHTDLLARAVNHLKQGVREATTDNDILRRRWMLIDCDPVRPSGISATDAELSLAIEKAAAVRGYLTDQGWPEPVVVMSGNGQHLLYRIDLPADDRGLVERLLHALSEKFDDDKVKIDTAVHNAARITKVPGTVTAGKGDDLRGVEGVPDRPHRRGRLEDPPTVVKVVLTEQLEAVAALSKATSRSAEQRSPRRATGRAGQPGRSPASVRTYLEDHGVTVSAEKRKGDHTLLFLDRCPVVPDCQSGNGTDIAVIVADDGMIAYRNLHQRGNGLVWADVRRALEPAEADESDGPGSSGPQRSQAAELVRLVRGRDMELFHTPGGSDSEPHITFISGQHRECWPLYSKAARQWLGYLFYTTTRKAIGNQAMGDALNILAGQALYEGPEVEVHLRLARLGDAIWLDLCDQEWRAVEVTSAGWRVVESRDIPVLFVRRRGMKPHPQPVRGGNISDLRDLVNVPDQQQWILVVAFMVGALRPGFPFPVLNINGEQGSAKSTLARMVRTLIDPAKPYLRRPPKDERDLMIAASNGWCLAYDNMSGLRDGLSDTLCSIATGGGFGTRELFTDGEEKLLDVRRPVILNGIDDSVTRSDLLDRCINLQLPAIMEGNRRSEDDLWSAFERLRPRLLGALLDAISAALGNYESVQLTALPRMADFAKWVVAAEPALPWQTGDFLRAYGENRQEANAFALDASPIARLLMAIVGAEGTWSGTASELLALLNERSTEADRRQERWPSNRKRIGCEFRRIAPNLRALRYTVHLPEKGTGHDKKRIFVLEAPADERSARSASSAAPHTEPPPPVDADHPAPSAVRRVIIQADGRSASSLPLDAANGAADRADHADRRSAPSLDEASSESRGGAA